MNLKRLKLLSASVKLLNTVENIWSTDPAIPVEIAHFPTAKNKFNEMFLIKHLYIKKNSQNYCIFYVWSLGIMITTYLLILSVCIETIFEKIN